MELCTVQPDNPLLVDLWTHFVRQTPINPNFRLCRDYIVSKVTDLCPDKEVVLSGMALDQKRVYQSTQQGVVSKIPVFIDTSRKLMFA